MSASSHSAKHAVEQAHGISHHKDTLYYDGSCPLCSKEIHHLQRLQQGGLVCLDIHSNLPSGLPKDKEKLLNILHLYTANGKCLTGLDATVTAWQHTSAGWLFRWLRWPVIRFIADPIYLRWANRRFSKKYDCGCGVS